VVIGNRSAVLTWARVLLVKRRGASSPREYPDRINTAERTIESSDGGGWTRITCKDACEIRRASASAFEPEPVTRRTGRREEMVR